MEIWRTHTGSAPGCQDNPTTQISNWFYGEKINISDARTCFNSMLEKQHEAEDYYTSEYGEDTHRCFNRIEYALDLNDVKNIIRKLKMDKRRESND